MQTVVISRSVGRATVRDAKAGLGFWETHANSAAPVTEGVLAGMHLGSSGDLRREAIKKKRWGSRASSGWCQMSLDLDPDHRPFFFSSTKAGWVGGGVRGYHNLCMHRKTALWLSAEQKSKLRRVVTGFLLRGGISRWHWRGSRHLR